MRTGLTFAALLAIVIGLWWVATGERPAPRAEAAAEPRAATPVAPPAAPAAAKAIEREPSVQPPPAATTQLAAPAQQADPPSQPAASGVAPPMEQGPVQELAQRFATEPRASSAVETERHVEAAFRDPTIPSNMLKSVICRQTVCKLEVRWTEQSYPGYVLGLTRAVGSFSDPLAIRPGPPDADGVRLLEVYWGRSPAPAQ